MCDDGNYRESRWFSSWKKEKQIESHYLPRIITKITGQTEVAFGDAVISTKDTCIGNKLTTTIYITTYINFCLGFEICEELWFAKSTHIDLSLDGVEIICNSSGSHTELRKGYVTVDLVKSATMKAGGCYVFSNLRGCGGERMYYNGLSSIALNGDILCVAKQFSLEEVVSKNLYSCCHKSLICKFRR